MSGIDPQHQAVKDATATLKANRYWQRSATAQEEYLNDVAELAREVAFILTKSGVTWDSVVSGVNDATGTIAQLLTLDPSARLEYALTTAVNNQVGKTQLRVID